jgi:hypothetical protein
MAGKKITIKPFSTTVIESEGNGAQLPPNLAFYLNRGPGLNSGLRLNPFINKGDEGAFVSIVIVNETNKPITLPKYELIGTLDFSRVGRQNINSSTDDEEPSVPLDFKNNLPQEMPEIDRENITKFLESRRKMFATKTGELGKNTTSKTPH